MTTKEQERKALEQIRKIINGLGENSYIGTAFEGCLEDAEVNIENDFAFSWKDRAETAGRRIDELTAENAKLQSLLDTYRKELTSASDMIGSYKRQIAELEQSRLTDSDIEDLETLLNNEIATAEQNMRQSAEMIVELADTPNDIGFGNAVMINRAAKKKISYCTELKTRLESTKK